MNPGIDEKIIISLIGEKEYTILKSFDDFVLEIGIPNNLSDSEKFSILSKYIEFHQHINNILYLIETRLKKVELLKSIEESSKFKDLKENEGIKSSAERKEMILSTGSSKLINLLEKINDLESLKWFVLNKFNLINYILKMY